MIITPSNKKVVENYREFCDTFGIPFSEEKWQEENENGLTDQEAIERHLSDMDGNFTVQFIDNERDGVFQIMEFDLHTSTEGLSFDTLLEMDGISFDDSGIDNPRDWAWDNPGHLIPNIYFPVRRVFKQLHTTGELHSFFGGEIPADLYTARQQAREEGYFFEEDVYLCALQEQENP